MNTVDIAFTSALEQARLIGNKEISPLELTQLYLDRIEQLDSSLKSFFTVMAERAIANAKAKTEQLSNEKDLPPFFGVPNTLYNRQYENSEVQAIHSQAQSITPADYQCCWSYLQSCDCFTSSVLPNVGQTLELCETSEAYCQATEA